MDGAGRLDDGTADLALIERWKGGDQRAAAEIVARHAQALARFAASSGEREELDELVQDTFVRAFNSLESFRADSSLRTWLFTILRRLILDRKRGEKRRRNQVELDEGHAVQAYDALDVLVADETAVQVRKAIEQPVSPLQERGVRPAGNRKGWRTAKSRRWSAALKARAGCTITTRCDR